MATPPPGTRAVRSAHAFDDRALEHYLASHAAGFVGPLGVWQYAGGQSNPTFLLQAASGDYVLHLRLLHVGLAIRVIGDLAPWPVARLWGGGLNGLAILLFLGATVHGILVPRRST